MALGLYKPGQGYWVRVMTASLAAVLVLAACGWAWAQVRLIPIPVPRWTLTVTPVTGSAVTPPPTGSAIELLNDAGATIGTARVLRSEPASGGADVLIGRVRMTGQARVTQTERVATPSNPPGGAPTVFGKVTARVGEPAVQPLYVQAAAALLLMVAGTGFIYWLVGVNPRTSEFLIATDGEMKKVNWSSRKGIIDSTWVVILWSVLLAAGLFIVDFAFSQVFALIGVLQRE